MLSPEQIKKAMTRIQRGERATIYIPRDQEATARAIVAKLSPRLQALLTLEFLP